jgi:predicted GIY-YIG superfamily endonuclease
LAGSNQGTVATAEGDRVAYVYLLRCSGGSLYCGWTFDVEKRLAAHRSGRGARYTRRRLPLELAAVIEMPDESSARREEARIKRLTRAEKLDLVREHSAGPVVGRRRAASAIR